MNRICFSNGRIVTADGVVDRIVLTLDGGRIAALSAGGDADRTIDLDGGWMMPGFIDTQVNGGGGVLFNDDPTPEGVAAIARAHMPYGTTAMLPTLISDDPSVIARALDAVDAAIDAGTPGIVGVHIEGPFLNVSRKGIHDSSKFRRLDTDTMALLTQGRRGRVMLTLAPELADPAQIRALAEAGVLVCGGHTDATYEETMAAIDAGLRGFTHLYNAMSPLKHRAPGVVGAVLDDQTTWAGLIVDGAHLHPAVIRIAMRARPVDRLMLVTDAMPTVGQADKRFTLQGKAITVENGVCVNADGTLAGSDLDMATAVRNMVATTGTAPETAAAMASTYPAAFLRLDDERGSIAAGMVADWVTLTAGFTVTGTWIGGEQVHAGE
ncbi:N-acetylglucosamine-6-phosphate deacetylase [Sphingomonas sp. Leaf17]|uniref:N-acetylglucosamine-6-phosphate deacetylase n=1 Tax=Sphingomonas sp. Leaf17 TaxID=1735683 RepID=UPI0006FABBA3|nr:N-acetylglucosamine-6-phosphate deacetylase [Sphingomonas sp. Leaf17]KQM63375.1 N-acetylglucosamine-6-phosphate deacetylase [Sphingomonas sp. Leaf17]